MPLQESSSSILNVVRHLRAAMKCEDCIEALTHPRASTSTLFDIKNRGGLLTPSDDVVTISRYCEVVFRNVMCNGNIPQEKNLLRQLVYNVFKMCVNRNVFHSLGHHFLDQEPENNHFLWLLEAISRKYFNIRLHHYSKIVNEKIHLSRVRQKFTKLILFLGQ